MQEATAMSLARRFVSPAGEGCDLLSFYRSAPIYCSPANQKVATESLARIVTLNKNRLEKGICDAKLIIPKEMQDTRDFAVTVNSCSWQDTLQSWLASAQQPVKSSGSDWRNLPSYHDPGSVLLAQGLMEAGCAEAEFGAKCNIKLCVFSPKMSAKTMETVDAVKCMRDEGPRGGWCTASCR